MRSMRENAFRMPTPRIRRIVKRLALAAAGGVLLIALVVEDSWCTPPGRGGPAMIILLRSQSQFVVFWHPRKQSLIASLGCVTDRNGVERFAVAGFGKTNFVRLGESKVD